jgi:hypothetical protein
MAFIKKIFTQHCTKQLYKPTVLHFHETDLMMRLPKCFCMFICIHIIVLLQWYLTQFVNKANFGSTGRTQITWRPIHVCRQSSINDAQIKNCLKQNHVLCYLHYLLTCFTVNDNKIGVTWTGTWNASVPCFTCHKLCFDSFWSLETGNILQWQLNT